jgi:thiol-disulfide isomerase/thioredoxin
MTPARKQTTDVRQAWLLGGVVVSLVLFFGLIVLPYVDPGKRAGLPAPDFALEVIHGGDQGNRIRLADLRGKVVVLDFWASWCGPCRDQMPIVDAVAKSYESRDVMVIGVNTSDTREQALAFVEAHPVSYASVIDEDGSTGQLYGVTKLPTIVVISKDGTVVYSAASVIGERNLSEIVDRAIKESS